MPLINYIRLGKTIQNWPLYFKKKYQDAVYITRGGLEMEVPKEFFYVFKEIFMEDFYSIDNLLKHVPDKPTIVDIGGNVGYFSFLIASKRKNAQVLTFEPMVKNCKVFQSNIERNKDLAKRIRLDQKAVTGTEQAYVSLFFDDTQLNTVVASVYPEFSEANRKEIKIDAISLARIIDENKLNKIDLLKLDCEGSEYPILYESPEKVWPLIKCLVMEVHDMDNDKRNIRYLSSFIKNKGYVIDTKPVEEKGCYYLLAYRI